MYIALADNQDITRAGMMYVCQELGQVEMRRAEDKAGLIEQLKQHPEAVVVLDYTLFDINDVEEAGDTIPAVPIGTVGLVQCRPLQRLCPQGDSHSPPLQYPAERVSHPGNP